MNTKYLIDFKLLKGSIQLIQKNLPKFTSILLLVIALELKWQCLTEESRIDASSLGKGHESKQFLDLHQETNIRFGIVFFGNTILNLQHYPIDFQIQQKLTEIAAKKESLHETVHITSIA